MVGKKVLLFSHVGANRLVKLPLTDCRRIKFFLSREKLCSVGVEERKEAEAYRGGCGINVFVVPSKSLVQDRSGIRRFHLWSHDQSETIPFLALSPSYLANLAAIDLATIESQRAGRSKLTLLVYREANLHRISFIFFLLPLYFLFHSYR